MSKHPLVPRVRRASAVFACCIAGLIASAAPAAGSQSDYDRAYELGLEAYKYGLPLVEMDKTFRHHTSINVPDGSGFGPVNRFNHLRNLTDDSFRSVVSPNNDTLYSITWIDLRREPQVLHVPRVNRERYFVLPLMDPYTENFKNLGWVNRTKPGDYVITGPGQHRTELPEGTRRIRSRYSRVWLVGRTQVFNAKDVKRVRKIQNRYSLTPLSKYGTDWRPPEPEHPDTTVDEPELPTGLAYFNKLGAELAKFPPPPRDAPILQRLATVGIGPGIKTSELDLSADVRRGLRDAVSEGPDSVSADLRTEYLSGFLAHNGWAVLPVGAYGTDYTLRAIVAQVGLGALRPEEAIYPLTVTDLTTQSLSGSNRYVINLDVDELPMRAFWSLTLYDSEGFFVPNEIDRWLINDRTDLHLNEDGSADIFIQQQEPASEEAAKNWLPAPAGEFRLIMRLYGPPPEAIPGTLDGSGWRPPEILPCAVPEPLELCPLL